jgi:hypothetical protein
VLTRHISKMTPEDVDVTQITNINARAIMTAFSWEKA